MRGLLTGAVAAIALAAAGPALGQARGPKPEPSPEPPPAPPPAPLHGGAVSIGQSFDYRTSNGRRLHMTLVEASGGRFVWDLHDVTGPGAPPLVARITQDAEFRIVVNQDAAGGLTRYDPHDCEKVVGICRYTVHRPDGTSVREMRVNGIADGVWNYSLWREVDGENRPVGIGEICYDAAGVSLRESWTDMQSAAGYTLERIMPDDTLADCSGAASPLE